MAREAIKENFRDSRYVEGKRRNIVLMPHVKVIRRNKKPSNLYMAYVEFLDRLGTGPRGYNRQKGITVHGVDRICMAYGSHAGSMIGDVDNAKI